MKYLFILIFNFIFMKNLYDVYVTTNMYNITIFLVNFVILRLLKYVVGRIRCLKQLQYTK